MGTGRGLAVLVLTGVLAGCTAPADEPVAAETVTVVPQECLDALRHASSTIQGFSDALDWYRAGKDAPLHGATGDDLTAEEWIEASEAANEELAAAAEKVRLEEFTATAEACQDAA